MPGIDDVDLRFRPPGFDEGAEASRRAQRHLSGVESTPVRRATRDESAALARMRDLVSAEDRREVRRQALACACQIADMEWGVNEVLATAARFERYLLGEDPPKQASAEEQLAGFGFGLAPPKPPAKME